MAVQLNISRVRLSSFRHQLGQQCPGSGIVEAPCTSVAVASTLRSLGMIIKRLSLVFTGIYLTEDIILDKASKAMKIHFGFKAV